MPRKEGHLLVDGEFFKKQTLNIPLSMVKLLIINTPSHNKAAGVLPNSVAGKEGNH